MSTTINTLLPLAGVLLLSVASPGPNFVIVTSSAVAQRRAGVMTGLGLAAASGTWAAIAIGGLSLLVTHVAWVHTALRLAGATYLIWLGLKMVLTARKPLSVAAPASSNDRIDHRHRRAARLDVAPGEQAQILAMMRGDHLHTDRHVIDDSRRHRQPG